MNLGKKKKLAKRIFGIGEDRIVFLQSRINEIKDAITKQDIRDLVKSGAIRIKGVKGRKNSMEKGSRSTGNIRKKINKRKRNYVILTRKLRAHARGLYSGGSISKDDIENLRKRIRNKEFRNKTHMKELLGEMKK